MIDQYQKPSVPPNYMLVPLIISYYQFRNNKSLMVDLKQLSYITIMDILT